MTEPDEESDLIKQAQRGDRGAFESLLRTHYDAMYRMAFKWCGNKEDAEDITQNACIKLARSIDTFRFQSAFLSWLYRLVINTAKDWAKARAPRAADQTVETERVEAPVAEERVYAGQVMAYVRTTASAFTACSTVMWKPSLPPCLNRYRASWPARPSRQDASPNLRRSRMK